MPSSAEIGSFEGATVHGGRETWQAPPRQLRWVAQGSVMRRNLQPVTGDTYEPCWGKC